jgi:hypothetical protein
MAADIKIAPYDLGAAPAGGASRYDGALARKIIDGRIYPRPFERAAKGFQFAVGNPILPHPQSEKRYFKKLRRIRTPKARRRFRLSFHDGDQAVDLVIGRPIHAQPV